MTALTERPDALRRARSLAASVAAALALTLAGAACGASTADDIGAAVEQAGPELDRIATATTTPATATPAARPLGDDDSDVIVRGPTVREPIDVLDAEAAGPITLPATPSPDDNGLRPTTTRGSSSRGSTGSGGGAAADGPIAPPSAAAPAEPVIELGAISIPKLGVDRTLYSGIHLSTLDRGPGHWPGTALPGEVGNVVVAAHRTSHGGPFRHIDTLVAGDLVQFSTASGTIDYRVTSTEVVPPTAMWIVDQTPTATATLFACHPPGSVRERIVVHLELDA